MEKKYVLALDQGTTSSRAVIFDRKGTLISVAQKEFAQHYPKAGWVEHDPLEIWSSQAGVAKDVLQRANIDAGEIAAVGITNQRETTLVWDRWTGKPVYPAIVWQDRRTSDRCRDLKKSGVEDWVREKTGLLLDPYFSATKVQWILENVEGAKERAEKGDLLFGTVDTWLIWNLTDHKVFITDVSNASRTLLFNITTGDWDDQLLELFGVPREMLPEVKSSSEVYGHIGSAHLPGNLPLAGIAGDQQAALFGQACFTPGMVKNTYGTGCFLVMQTGTELVRSKNNLLTTIAWKIGDVTEYALEGSIFMGGAVIQWLRDEMKMIESARECDRLAETVPDSNGLILVPAFSGLGAPHWDPYARGTALGMTRGTNRAHFCRAALESIAFQSGDLIRSMEKDSGVALKELRVDGGASRSEPLMQFQADLLQTSVVRPQCIETTALGSAYLAGLAVGFWQGKEDITRNWTEGKRFEPKKDADKMEVMNQKWIRAVERAKGWVE